MKKNLRKNKKGFTLVEIIVVLLIIGILLAITIPSIMGYVGKAQNAKYEAQARSGYVAAQTITTKLVANDDDIQDTALQAAITPTNIAKELGETKGNTIVSSGCNFDNKKIVTCAFTVKDKTGEAVVFRANPTGAEEPTEMVEVSGNTVVVTPAGSGENADPAVSVTLLTE